MALTDKLTAIGDAIREKTGGTELLTLDAMPDEIRSIETGGDTDALAGMIDGTITNVKADGVMKARDYIFRKADIVTLDLPDLTTVGDYFCQFCSYLETVNLPKLTNLKIGAFTNCVKLKEIVLPSLTTVSSYASYLSNAEIFGWCYELTKADLGAPNYIRLKMFTYCTKLEKLILRGETMTILENTNAFHNTPIASGTGYIYVPDSLVDTYKADATWSTYANQIKPLSELEG